MKTLNLKSVVTCLIIMVVFGIIFFIPNDYKIWYSIVILIVEFYLFDRKIVAIHNNHKDKIMEILDKTKTTNNQ